MTSIEELLRHTEDEPASGERRSRSGIGSMIATIVYAAGLAAVILLALRAVDLSVPYVLAFAVMLALLLLRKLVRSVAAPPRTRSALVRRSSALADESEYQWGALDGLRVVTGRWESRLEWGHDDPARFARAIQERLVELADERLRLRHGISRAGEPARARAVLGEPLWTFLASPVRKPPSPRELAAILTRMEEF